MVSLQETLLFVLNRCLRKAAGRDGEVAACRKGTLTEYNLTDAVVIAEDDPEAAKAKVNRHREMCT